jgi:hypothetical protein
MAFRPTGLGALGLLGASLALAEPGTLRVADATSWPGYVAAMRATYGGTFPDTSVRFDPADSFEIDGSLPRPFDVLRIRFLVEPGEPTGTLTVQVHEQNGGQKPDEARVLASTTTTAAPGWNTVDLAALGQTVRIDPPRMFCVTFKGQGLGGAPFVAADDGLPYVGGTGDFHTSVAYVDANCNVRVFGFAPPSDAAGEHSSNLMVELDVDFLAPPATPRFVVNPTMGGCTRCAWGDIDGDGDLDGLDTGSVVWRNEGGGVFANVTAQALPAGTRGLNGGLFADHDADGDLDYFGQTGDCAPCGGRSNLDTIMRNRGDTNGDGVPEFEDVRTVDWGDAPGAPVPGDDLPTEGAAWGDWNGDGWLDLYLANHVDWASGACFVDTLWINDGPPAFTFTNAGPSSGVAGAVLCGRGVAPADFDADGDQDVFVTNYRLNPDFLWENRGVDVVDLPVFANVAASRGVQGTENLAGSGAYGHGIGAAWGDVNRDQSLDLIVGNLAHSAWLCFSDTTKLYLSSGGATPAFTDVRPASGIAYNELHSEASFADWDNDADLDVFVTHAYDGWRSSVWECTATDPPTYADDFGAAGIGMRSGWGSAWADVDRDGDLDLWTRGGLHVNQTPAGPLAHWLEVRLLATRSNVHSLGARVTVTAGVITQTADVASARGTSSQDDLVRHFGLADAPIADRVHVRWPSGCELELRNVAADRVLDLTEPECLIPRFRVLGVPTTPGGREARVGCVNATLTLVDDSIGSPTAWEWDLDSDGLVDATGPSVDVAYPFARTYDVTLAVDDGTSPARYVTKPVRIDAPPGAPVGPWAEDPNPCLSDLTIQWEPATWGAAGGGVYNVYQGSDEADALSRPPVALGLTIESFVDTMSAPGIASTYVIEAEDARAPGGCDPGPHHGGSTARLTFASPTGDQVRVPRFTTVRAEDADPCTAGGGILVSWDAATFFDPTRSGTYHVYRSVTGCPDPTSGQPPIALGLTSLSFLDTTVAPGTPYVYTVMAEDARTASFCRPIDGPRNRGEWTAACAAGAVTDVAEAGSADPGNVLRARRDPASPEDVVLDWSRTTVTPQAGEAHGALAAPSARGPWTLLPPGRLAATTVTDRSAATATLRFYRATLLSPSDCPAPDPFRR